MRNIKLNSILLVAAFGSTVEASAQNTPGGSGAPSGSATTPTPPKEYDASPNSTPSKFNYTRTFVPRQSSTSTSSLTLTAAPSHAAVSTTYTNGFGQPLQSTLRRAGRDDAAPLDLKDLTTVYDQRAASSKVGYLPFPTTLNSSFVVAPFADQAAYYGTLYPDEGGTAHTWQEVVAGPATISYKPGKSFVGQYRGVYERSEVSSSSFSVRKWLLTVTDIPYSSGTYVSTEITRKETLGEHGIAAEEYFDRDGKLLCKRACYSGTGTTRQWLVTYYVYDDMSRLRYIITPKAVDAMGTTGSLTTALREGLCYYYKYNDFGQVIEKRVPGKIGLESTVYDLKHRPVLYQTPLQAQQGEWSFTVYDNLNRPIVNGVFSSASSGDALQGTVNSTTTPASGSLWSYLLNDFNGNYPNTITDCEINDYSYYDQYNQHADLGGRAYDNSFATDLSTGSTAIANTPYGLMQGLLTGKRVRVMDGGTSGLNTWINTVLFYDQQGRVIQTQTLNPWNATDWDITTIQYNFSGQIIRQVNNHHAWSSCNKPATKTVLNNNYDSHLGRLVNVTQRIDGSSWRNISSYKYDRLGRVSSKWLGNVEVQKYKYRIDGSLASINEEYVDDVGTALQSTFGCKLMTDYGFNQPRYDGNLSGIIWRGAGAGSRAQAYGYNYDIAGRLLSADYRELTACSTSGGGGTYTFPCWNKSKTDYSVNSISYDPNGNLLTMNQRGVGIVGGISTPVDMDILDYTYNPSSNRLQKVEDAVTDDYNLHDFLNNNVGAPDYSYDVDGNLTVDYNKGIADITYNHLDLPLTIQTGTGTIDNLYDASGVLIQKTITPVSGSPTVYRYWGPFVYKDNELQHFLHEEGRCRFIPGTGGGASSFAYDYFVKDHLGNVRTVVNAEPVDMLEYFASLEVIMAGTENLLFEHIDDVRDIRPASVDPADTRAARLNSDEPDRRIGTALLLRVMAGDKFKAKALSYHQGNEGDPVGAPSMLSAIVGALTAGEGGIGGEGGNAEIINNLFSWENYVDQYSDLLSQTTDPLRPAAYLNYVVFDEQMQLVPDQSGAIQAGAAPNVWETLETSLITIGRNGYLALYVSRVAGGDHYFDNILLEHYRGKLLEEQHYYPHGLTIKGGALSPLPNRHQYQGKEMQDELGLELYDFHARQYDPQIGRFWGIDPADQFPSGYTGMGNDPANLVDPTGTLATGMGSSQHQNNQYVPDRSDSWGAWLDALYERVAMDQEEQMLMSHWGGGGGGSGQGDGEPGEQSPNQGDEDPTNYINSNGTLLYKVNDGKEDYTMIAPSNMADFLSFIKSIEGNKDAYDPNELSLSLNAYGTTIPGNHLFPGMFDIPGWVGPSMMLAGKRVYSLKPAAYMGSKPGSSFASTKLSREFPGKFTDKYPKYGPRIVKFTGTNVIGRFYGRLVPVIGAGLTAYDAYTYREEIGQWLFEVAHYGGYYGLNELH